MPVANRTTCPVDRLARAVEHLRQAILLIEEAAPGVLQGFAPGITIAPPQPVPAASSRSVRPQENGSVRPAIIDEATFSILWRDRACRLGNTVAFSFWHG